MWTVDIDPTLIFGCVWQIELKLQAGRAYVSEHLPYLFWLGT